MTYVEVVRELLDLVLELKSDKIRVNITHEGTEILLFENDSESIGKISISNSNWEDYELWYWDYIDRRLNYIDRSMAKKYIENAAR